jgi:hypothetical protein
MQLYTRDWLDSTELRRCSPLARSVLTDLMCMAHEGTPYGFISDKIGGMTDEYLASRFVVPLKAFKEALAELEKAERLHVKDGIRFIKRMVDDEDLRIRRAAGGAASQGNPKVPRKVIQEGYPSAESIGSPSSKIDSRERARAESDCGSDSKKSEMIKPQFGDFPLTYAAITSRFPSADVPLIHRILMAAGEAFTSVSNPKITHPDDAVFAEAVEVAARESRNQNSAALFITTVPIVISNWAKNGRGGPVAVPRKPLDPAKILPNLKFRGDEVIEG